MSGLRILLVLGVIAIANGVHLAYQWDHWLLVVVGYLLIFLGAMSLSWFNEGLNR